MNQLFRTLFKNKIHVQLALHLNILHNYVANLLKEDFIDENTPEAACEGSTSKTLQEQLCSSASPLIPILCINIPYYSEC